MTATLWFGTHPIRRCFTATALGAATFLTATLTAVPARAQNPATPAPMTQTCVSSVVTDGAIQSSALVVSRDLTAHSTAEGWQSCSVG